MIICVNNQEVKIHKEHDSYLCLYLTYDTIRKRQEYKFFGSYDTFEKAYREALKFLIE